MNVTVIIMNLLHVISSVAMAADPINTYTPFNVVLGSTPNKYPSMVVETEILRYNRCYAHLMRTIVPKADARLSLIKSKAINGSEACMDLLKKAKLDNSGMLVKDTNGQYNTEAKTVFKTINDFHRSWFPTYDYRSAVPTGECFNDNNYRTYNNGEMALHLTNAIFNKEVPFSSIVTNRESFEAVRDDRSGGTKTINNQSTATTMMGPNSAGTPVEFTPTYMSAGNIIGLKDLEPATFPNGVDFRSSVGGGIIGTVPYMLLNSGRNNNETINGGLRQHRRWSQAILSDLFCREIPVVRSADAIKKVQADSTVPFRQGISCMQCHASIDPLSQIQRNASLKFTNSCNAGTVSFVSQQAVDKPQETLEQVDADTDFHKRPPKGTFYFRTYDGRLLNHEATGVQEMGEYLATVDDLYICAAKRYFQFFTGIDVPMFDAGDFTAPVLSQKQTIYRNMVIDMGLELKKSQNLEVLVNKIISSEAYISPGKGE